MQEQACLTTLLSTAQLWYEQEDTQLPQPESGVLNTSENGNW